LAIITSCRDGTRIWILVVEVNYKISYLPTEQPLSLQIGKGIVKACWLRRAFDHLPKSSNTIIQQATPEKAALARKLTKYFITSVFRF
jgi:hypothetical protein